MHREELEPGLLEVLTTVEASIDRIVRDATAAIWEQVSAYPASWDDQLRADVTAHIETIFRALMTSVRQGRPVQRADFPLTADQARRRVRQGVSLPDFMHAYRVAQLTLWDGVVAAARDDPIAREAALLLARTVMQLIEVGSSAAAESYLEAQKYELAENDRLRRDVLEDLLAGADITVGAKAAALRSAGLHANSTLFVLSAVPIAPLPEQHSLTDIATALRQLLPADARGLMIVRQQEVVGVVPISPDTFTAMSDHLRQVVARLSRDHAELVVGVSTIRGGLDEVRAGYAEAGIARNGCGGAAGVFALPLISAFDYVMLREDETVRRLIGPRLRRFVEDDLATGGTLVTTVLSYVANDLNATLVAEQLHLHVNSTYYRLDRIAELSGCNMRRFDDVIELLIAIRILSNEYDAMGTRTSR
ncbi:PucR family transcriptional regulator [Nocardia sp. NPDC060220]|uniref:PucR family transcriptional regulator n=1 Tax=Nocardia sp. NPDC060220 TaxID=3347076 RepID=UPI00364C2CB8